jgi:hypothetical protein
MAHDFKPLKFAIPGALAELPVQTDRMRRLQALCASCDSVIEKDMAQALRAVTQKISMAFIKRQLVN